MIHHVSVGSNDVARAKAFYDPVMEAMGLRCLKSRDGAVDYGSTRLIFSIETPVDRKPATAGNGVHIAFDVEERGQVDAFHAAGLANGGTDAGAGAAAEIRRQLSRRVPVRSGREQGGGGQLHVEVKAM